jgi:hypothetical protein
VSPVSASSAGGTKSAEGVADSDAAPTEGGVPPDDGAAGACVDAPPLASEDGFPAGAGVGSGGVWSKVEDAREEYVGLEAAADEAESEGAPGIGGQALPGAVEALSAPARWLECEIHCIRSAITQRIATTDPIVFQRFPISISIVRARRNLNAPRLPGTPVPDTLLSHL